MLARTLLLIVFLPWKGMLAGEKKVQLKDGTVKSIRVGILGNPFHYKDKVIRVLDIHPAVETLRGNAPPSICWQFQVDFRSGFYGTILISSPYAAAQARAVLDPQTWNANLFRDAGIESFDRRSAPGVWDWLKSDEEAWIPFHFKILGVDGKLLEEFDDWGHVSAQDIPKARKDMATLHQPDLHLEQRSMDLPGGEHLKATLLDGNPVHYSSREFGISNLEPAVLPSKDHKTVVPIWILRGWSEAPRKSHLTITSPWYEKSFTQSEDVGPTGRFVMVFASEADAPDSWRWIEDGGDTWFPWKIHVESTDYPEGKDVVEWVRITPDAKVEIRKRLSGIKK